MIVYPLTVIHLMSSYNVRLLNYSQAVVVPMGLATDKQEIHYRAQVSQGERKSPQMEGTSMHEQWFNLCLYHWY